MQGAIIRFKDAHVANLDSRYDLSKTISGLPPRVRTFLVALILQVEGKLQKFIRFPEMVQAVNSHCEDTQRDVTFSREDARECLYVLRECGLLRGGPTHFTQKLNYDDYAYEVVPTIIQALRASDLEEKHKSRLRDAQQVQPIQ